MIRKNIHHLVKSKCVSHLKSISLNRPNEIKEKKQKLDKDAAIVQKKA